jgi:quinoprotein dehydrogenase-associated probable ABC transporter substrate-binding protein
MPRQPIQPHARRELATTTIACLVILALGSCTTSKAPPSAAKPRDLSRGSAVVTSAQSDNPADTLTSPGCDCAEPTPATRPSPSPNVLVIGADPNNLPFTNDRLEGFENKIAQIIADELGMTIQYDWRAQRRGFFRHTLKQGEAELVLGVPKGFDMALTTAPYYRSTYAFVYRKDRNLHVRSFDDPDLRNLKVAVQLVGNDGVNTPPAHALARRGIITNVVGYTVYGDYRDETPPARIMDAVVNRDVDLAVVWGPLAGYYTKSHNAPLEVVPVSPDLDPPALAMAFNIAMGVRKGNTALKDRLDAALTRRRADIRKILDDYGIPWLEPKAPPAKSARADEHDPKGGPRS